MSSNEILLAGRVRFLNRRKGNAVETMALRDVIPQSWLTDLAQTWTRLASELEATHRLLRALDSDRSGQSAATIRDASVTWTRN